jgi:putative membrane protein
MFIDYITLMLINMVAGLVLLADFVYRGLDGTNLKRWIPGFGIVGAIALATGLHMMWTWPVPGSFNISFGETTVMFGFLYVGAAIAIAMSWDLLTLTVYGFFAGLTAVLVGVRIINLEQTRQPIVAGIGFILTGLGGVLAAPTLVYLKTNKAWRTVGAIVLLLAALVWAIIGYRAYWGHLSSFSEWQPPVMRGN